MVFEAGMSALLQTRSRHRFQTRCRRPLRRGTRCVAVDAELKLGEGCWDDSVASAYVCRYAPFELWVMEQHIHKQKSEHAPAAEAFVGRE